MACDELDRSAVKSLAFPNYDKTEQSVKKKFSKSVIGDGRKERKVTKFETETASRKVTVKFSERKQVTSDYSSQSDGEHAGTMVTSTPKTSWRPITGGSPRLRAFDGDGWVWSPRTSYTYAQSLTYRDMVTPGREIPMPHMTRMPLGSYTPTMDHTELWELSEIQLSRDRLGDISDGDYGPSPPHLIYRRNAGNRKNNFILSTFFSYLLLPILWFLSIVKTLFYEYLLHFIKSTYSHLSMFQSTIITSKILRLLCDLLEQVSSLPGSLLQLFDFAHLSETKSTVENSDQETEIMTEDEDEVSGLNTFLSNQKHLYSSLEQQTTSKHVQKQTFLNSVEHFWTKIVNIFFSLISTFSQYFVWNKLIAEKKYENVKKNPPSVFATLKEYFSYGMNWRHDVTAKTPKRVIFKDVPEMPLHGAIDPYISEDEDVVGNEIQENVHYIEENGELLLNSVNNPNTTEENQREPTKFRISKFNQKSTFLSVLLYPFVYLQLFASISADRVTESWIKVANFLNREKATEEVTPKRKKLTKGKQKQSIKEWLWSFLYRKKPVRRSRRLQGLDPEQIALMEKKRRSQIRKKQKEPQFIETFMHENSEDELSDDNDEETELILKIYFRSIRKNIQNLFSYNDNESEVGSSELDATNLELSSPETLKRQSKAKVGIFHSFIAFMYQWLFKKQVRRSRRLKGLDPENSGQANDGKSYSKTRKMSQVTDKSGDTDATEDDIIDEEHYELFVKVWFKSLWEVLQFYFCKSVASEENSLLVEDSCQRQAQTKQRSILSLVKSFFFKIHLRRSRRLKRLQPENEGYLLRGWSSRRVNLRSSPVECNEPETETEQESEEVLEFRPFYVIKYLYFSIKDFFSLRRDMSLSAKNLRLHNIEMSNSDDTSDKSVHDVASWLRQQSHDASNTNDDNNINVSTMADLSTEEHMKLQQSKKETKIGGHKASLHYFFPAWNLGLFFKILLILLILGSIGCYFSPHKCSGVKNQTIYLMEMTNNATKEFYFSSKEIVGEGCNKAKDFSIHVSKYLVEVTTSGLSTMTNGAANLLQFCFSSCTWCFSMFFNILSHTFSSIQTLCGICFNYLKSVPHLLYSRTEHQLEKIWSIASTTFGTSFPVIFEGSSSLITSTSEKIMLMASGCKSSIITMLETISTYIISGFSFTVTSILHSAVSLPSIIQSYLSTSVTNMNAGASLILNSVYNSIVSTSSSLTTSFRDVLQVASIDNILFPLQWTFGHFSDSFIWTFNLMLNASASSLEAVKFIIYGGVEKVSSSGLESFNLLFSSVSKLPATVFTLASYALSAWNQTMLPPKLTQAPIIDYDHLIAKVLENEMFQSHVSNIARQKVEAETTIFEEKLFKISSSKEGEINTLIEEYKKSLINIKSEVSDEIKKNTEEISRTSINDNEKHSTENTILIQQLEERYNDILLEAQKLDKQKTIENKQSNKALLKEIEFLRVEMGNLISNQKTLNETLIKCCKNQTMIEVKVENYINDLLKNMQNGSKSELGKWINSIFVAKSELEQSLDEITASVETKIKQTLDRELIEITKNQADQTAQQVMNTISNNIQKEYMERKNSTNNDGSGSDRSQGGLSREEVFKIVKNALIQYDADKTGMFDYALETAGGSVISTRCTETYVQKTAMYSIFGIPVWYPSNNPRTVIQPGVQPGECWAFKGSTGFIVIKLSDGIIPTRFSMEHISKSMSPSGKIDSAPRDFVVYGLNSEKDPNPVKLGSYSYSQDLDPLQYFEVKFPSKVVFPYIELDIISNHGNVNYTCLYRFRVHGVLP